MSPATEADLATRYLPSNGSEGYDFEAAVCRGVGSPSERPCRYYVTRRNDPELTDCSRGIIVVALNAEPSDRSTWPKQWRRDARGFGHCTAFREREGKKRNDRAAYEAAVAGSR